MEPVSHSDIPESDEYWYQVKWDGVRMLSYVEGDQVRLINKRLNPRTIQYPELQQLPQLLSGHNAILDGEIIVLKDGQPSFPSVIRRDRCSASKTISYWSQRLPISYMLFDIVFLDKLDLTSVPVSERHKLLAQTLDFSSPLLYLVENFSDGRSLFEAVKANDMEGIVVKRKTSLYLAGKHHREWLKIKYRRSLNCVIGGYTMRGNQVNSLLLGIFQDEQLIYVGRAGSGLSESDRQTLSIELPSLTVPKSLFSRYSSSKIPEARFTKPLLTVRVEFAEWTEHMQLRSPVIKEFISIEPEGCTS